MVKGLLRSGLGGTAWSRDIPAEAWRLTRDSGEDVGQGAPRGQRPGGWNHYSRKVPDPGGSPCTRPDTERQCPRPARKAPRQGPVHACGPAGRPWASRSPSLGPSAPRQGTEAGTPSQARSPLLHPPGPGRGAGCFQFQRRSSCPRIPGARRPRGDRVTQPGSRAPVPSRSGYRLCLQLPPPAASVPPRPPPAVAAQPGLRGCLGTWHSSQRESLGPWPWRGCGEGPLTLQRLLDAG